MSPPVTTPGSVKQPGTEGGSLPSQDRRGTGTAPPRPRLRTGATRVADRGSLVARVRFRRAVVLMLMTLFLPGSAQLVVGDKRVGRIAMRVWLGCLGALALVVALGLLWHPFAFWLGSSLFMLRVIRLALVLLAVGWALLLIDSWRLGRPLELRQRQRLVAVGLNGVMVFVVAGSLLFASHIVAVQRGFIATMFGDGVVSAAEHGRYNVLLVGGDSGAGRWGLRTDSMTVASIDEETGRTILFGLPRNMMNFPFPQGSLLARQFPHGYDCSTCELNSLATWAGDHRSLFHGQKDPGMAATIQGVEGITGLKINYYTLVNLAGFRSLVDAMGGLTLNVRDAIPIGGGEQGQIGTIPAGVHKLNGYQVLWFSRSRMAADDYSRMARQKCVMNAMLQQLSPQTVITKFEALAHAGENMIETNLPASELDTFAELALKARSQQVSSVSFVPPAISTSEPDIAKIHAMITKAIDGSEKQKPRGTTAKPHPGKGFTTRSGGPSTGGSIGSMSSGYAANSASNLSKVC
jgi:polyisoprenyl-teichoic acid--peptidoglycan teichoic acid transferase